jgi:pyruvate carboxylase
MANCNGIIPGAGRNWVSFKASVGGDGRCMRIVARAEDLQRMFLEASSEASATFGDPLPISNTL